MNRRSLFVLMLAAPAYGCSKRVTYDTPSQKPERHIAATPTVVSAAFASNLVSTGFSVKSATDGAVVARKFEPRLHGLFTSPPPNTSTEAQYTFTFLPTGDGTRVVADASVVYINSVGEETTTQHAPNVIVEEMNAMMNSVNV